MRGEGVWFQLEVHMNKWFRPAFLALLVGVVFVGPGVAQGPPIPLDIEREDIPNTGRCRVWLEDAFDSDQPMQTGCNGIEFSAPLGSYVMYRPKDKREVHVCYMSTDLTGVVDGIDAFDIDRMTLIRVVLPRTRRTEDDTVKCSEGDKDGG